MQSNGGYPCPTDYAIEWKIGNNFTCNVAEILNADDKLRKAAALGLHSSDYALVIVSLSNRGSVGRLLWLNYARQDEHVRSVVEEIWLQASRDFNPPAQPVPTLTKVLVTNALKDRPDEGLSWRDVY
jgi:hypothetical protein